MQEIVKTLLYASTIRSYINVEAIFADETDTYLTPSEPKLGEKITLRLRTARNNVSGVFIHFVQDGLDKTRARKQFPETLPMKKSRGSEIFDFYSITIKAFKTRYFFSLSKDNAVYYYNKRGLDREVNHTYNFSIIPNFITPKWAKGAVMYQIFVDRFCNGKKSNDVVNNEYLYLGRAATCETNWNAPVPREDYCNFYGGDLQGVIDKLDYLTDLGVEIIYLSPVFVSPSSHKYDIQDYDFIDPHFAEIIVDEGEPLHYDKFHNRYATKYISRTTNNVNLLASNQLFAQFVAIAHERGIKVILDGVFNHCGAFNKWLDKENFYSGKGYAMGAYRDENSPYHDFFKWYDHNWPNNDCYDAWWGYDNHPKLNYETSKRLYEYVLNIGKKWVSPPFNADGWRLDVAADLGGSEIFNHQFWKDFRKAVKGANPEAIILAEHYGSPKNWLQGDEWDTIMNYDAFMEPITWFLTGMEKHSEAFDAGRLCNAMDFENSIRENMSFMTAHSLMSSMNELSNHDHSRFLTRTNMKVGRLHTVGAAAADAGVNLGIMMEAVVFQMTWPGSPTIYYGDEAGMTGWTDPDNRRTYPWGKENKSLIAFHKSLIGFRKKYGALRVGSVIFLYNDYGIITYGRWDDKDRILVALNNNIEGKLFKIPVWKMECALNGSMEYLLNAAEGNWSTDAKKIDIIDGWITINVGGYGCAVLREKV